MLEATRGEFSKLLNIPAPTITNWEIGKTFITRASVCKLIEALAAKANIILTEEWLLYGQGGSPFDNVQASGSNAKEEALFLLNNSRSILFEVPDSSYEASYPERPIKCL